MNAETEENRSEAARLFRGFSGQGDGTGGRRRKGQDRMKQKTGTGRPEFKSILAGVIAMCTLLTLLTGCIRQITGNGDPDPVSGTAGPYVPPVITPPGELVRVRHESSSGSMEPASDFAIEVTPEEIVRAEYWPEEFDGEYERREIRHVPVTAEQWADIDKIVGILYPVLEPVPEEIANAPADDEDDYMILDGGDYWNLWLTWRAEDGTETELRYYNTSDRRIRTFVSLLEELADPIGREIVWYDPPEIKGVFMSDDKKDESFQLTFFDDGRYYFIVRWTEGREKKSFSRIVDESVWPDFKAFLETRYFERFEEGLSFKDPLTVTVYYTDGAQKTFQPDRGTADAVREFFVAKVPEVEKMEKKG